MTLARLTQFAKDTNPLVTQLRPAARQLSPDAAGPLEARPRPQGPLHATSTRCSTPPRRACRRPRTSSTSSTRCWPTSTRRCASSTRRCWASGQYKSELNAFFANTVAATQATTQRGQRARALPAHDQPGQPREPRRLSAPARPPTAPTRTSSPTRSRTWPPGCSSYETRQCTGGPVPTLVTAAAAGPADRSDLADPGRPGGERAEVLLRPRRPTGRSPRPPCKQQGKFPFGGEVTQYPHVNAATGPTARALARRADRTAPPRRARGSHGLRQRPGAPGAARRGRLGDRRPRGGARRPGRGLRGARRLQRRAPRGGALPAHPDRPTGARSAPTASSPSATACPTRTFDSGSAGLPSQGVKGFIDGAVNATGRADRTLAQLQDSMRPVEVGDAELRAGLSEVRRLVADVPRRGERARARAGAVVVRARACGAARRLQPHRGKGVRRSASPPAAANVRCSASQSGFAEPAQRPRIPSR